MEPGFPLPATAQALPKGMKPSAAKDAPEGGLTFSGILMANVKSLKPMVAAGAEEPAPAADQAGQLPVQVLPADCDLVVATVEGGTDTKPASPGTGPHAAAMQAPSAAALVLAPQLLGQNTAPAGTVGPEAGGRAPADPDQTVSGTAGKPASPNGVIVAEGLPIPAAADQTMGANKAKAAGAQGTTQVGDQLPAHATGKAPVEIPEPAPAGPVVVGSVAGLPPVLQEAAPVAEDQTGQQAGGTGRPPLAPEPSPLQTATPEVQIEVPSDPAGAGKTEKSLAATMTPEATAKPLTVTEVLDLEARRLLRAMGETEQGKGAYTKPSTGSRPSSSAAFESQPPLETGAGKEQPASAEAEAGMPPAGAPDKPLATGAEVMPERADALVQPEDGARKAAEGTDHVSGAGKAPSETTPSGRQSHHTATVAQVQAPAHPRHIAPAHGGKVEVALKNHESAGATRPHGQVFRQVVANLEPRAGESHVKIQLHPEALGKVEVALVGRGHTLDVHMVADSPQAADALKGSLQDLTAGIKAKAGNFHHIEVHVEVREQPVLKADGQQQERREQPREQARQDGRGGRNQDQGGRDKQGERGGKRPRANPWFRTRKEDA